MKSILKGVKITQNKELQKEEGFIYLIKEDINHGHLYLDGQKYGNTSDMLSLESGQTLTEAQKQNVLTKLGIADEKINLTIFCEESAATIGAIITLNFDGNSQTFVWSGDTIEMMVPMFTEYTISFSSIAGYYAPDPVTYVAKKNVIRNITVSYDSAPYTDLSMKDIYGNDILLRETANCYVIHENGRYEIPLVYGCGIMSGETNTESYTQISGDRTSPFYNYLNRQIVSPFIEEDTNIQVASAHIVYTDNAAITISGVYVIQRGLCKFLRFQVENTPVLGGNAIIAIKDEYGQIMWSWHLWLYPFALTTKAHTNTKGFTYNFLDVNLGWVKNAADSKYGSCPYYQWGRKDPMLRANATAQEGTFSITSCASSLAATIQNPNVFNKYESTHYNWWKDNGTAVDFYNYWDAEQITTGNADKAIVKTIYDPCPVGFTIPCGNAFLGFSKDSGGTWDSGYTWDERYFPASGYRSYSSGGVYDFGSRGDYWLASSSSQAYAYSLGFNSGFVNPQNYYYRAGGFAVCPAARV